MTMSAMSGSSQGLNALAAALAPADSSGYASPPSPLDMAGAPPSGGVPGVDPSQGQAGDPNFPSTQPDIVSQVLASLIQMQQADQQNLMGAQQAALMGNPLFQALVSGAPVGPGAGQDGQGIGPSGMTMPSNGLGA